jgi:hypothetical protein
MWSWVLHRITGLAIFFFLLVHVLDTSAAAGLMPSLAAVRPLALPAAAAAGARAELQIWGFNLGGDQDSVLARSQGEPPAHRPPRACRCVFDADAGAPSASSGTPSRRVWLPPSLRRCARPGVFLTPRPSAATDAGRHLDVEITGLTAEPAWGGLQRLDVRVSGPLGPGSLQVEVMRGCYASGARTIVVAPTRARMAKYST